MKQSALEKTALKSIGDICACLREQNPSWNKLNSWIENLYTQEKESPEQQIDNHIRSLAIIFCMKNYSFVGRHMHQLNRLGVRPEVIKNSELYKLATKCVVQDFNRQIAAKNYETALNIIDIAKNLDIEIPKEINEKYYYIEENRIC